MAAELMFWGLALFALFLWMLVGNTALWFIAFAASPYIGYKVYLWHSKRNKTSLDMTATLNGVKQPAPAQARLDAVALDCEKNYSHESQTDRNYHAWPDVLQDGVEGIEHCIARGDWVLARVSVQQLTYTVGASSEQNQKDFHAYYCHFYKRDPLYQEVLKKLLELVNAEHGIVQSTIYKHFTGMSAETMRLHLYVAEQIGDIRRVKKGNSYKLFPVDVVMAL